ncbi:MFS transporter [Kitasatospora sp. NBC_01287]|uniref:MDR family MFS transporter n=1 Tax=Kitasatospora sp. NBC_01287 TaxID=2903573 RepID=UPI00224F052B|nr:MFS transporter [Kitasatospora sp. NBC_01287]MCX4748229.1 MFS transporter [Kitasatospora sp. NBC_01287]
MPTAPPAPPVEAAPPDPAAASLTARLRSATAESVGGLPPAFWWLWTSTLVNRLGGFVVTFLALYLTVDRGYSAAYAGLVASLFGLGGAIAALVGGVLTDRIGRRPTMLGAQLLTALSTAALGFADGRVMIAAVAFLVGLSSNASRPAISAVIADVVPAADRVRAFALNYWAVNIGFGVSAAVAGLVAAHGYLPLFIADAATTLLCACVVFARVPESHPSAAATPSGQGGQGGPRAAAPAVSLSTVFRDRRFMALVGLTFLVALVFQQGNTTLAVTMGRAGLSTTQFGLVIGLNGLLIVLLQIPVTRMLRGQGRGPLLLVAALLTGWGFGLTAFAGSSALCYAGVVAVWTLGEIIQAPTSMSLVAELAPAHARGRYQGVYSLAWSAASFLGPAAGGFLLDHAGHATVWYGCAALGTAAAGGYLVLGRRADAARQLSG